MRLLAALLAGLFLVTIIPLPSHAARTEETETAQAKSQERESYEKSMEERLQKLGKKLDELNAKTAAKTEEMRKDLKEVLAEAEQKREVAAKKLDDLRNASKHEWQKFAAGMNKAADELKKAYERAKARLKE